MSNFPAVIEILKGWNPSNLRLLIDHLNKHGIVTDEDGTGLSSYMIKSWDNVCTSLLSQHGYTGGDILKTGAYVEENGNVYALFDEASFDYTQVIEHIKQS
jgi:hypothetical protein